MEETKHAHAVTDQDLPFVIDPITKEVASQGGSLVVPQHAKNSERFTFTIPDRRIEGHDMSEVNQVFVHFRNIGVKGEVSAGIYKVEDLAVADDSVTLSWLIDNDATYYVGALIFSIHFICNDESGQVVYDLPTLTYSKISVGETVWNSEEIVKQYPDIIAQLESRISALEAGGTGATPIACLYNGIQLPPLPAYDRAKYPYAVICTYKESSSFGGFPASAVLYLFTAHPEASGGDTIELWLPQIGDLKYTIEAETTQGLLEFTDWGSPTTITERKGPPIANIKWANFDMYYQTNIDGKKGQLYLAATEPVPVYPENGNGSAEAVDAVLYTPQTPTPKQQEQARKNIGVEVSVPVMLDLADYGIDYASLLLAGGGAVTYEDVGSFWEDVNAVKPGQSLLLTSSFGRFLVVPPPSTLYFETTGSGTTVGNILTTMTFFYGSKLLVATSYLTPNGTSGAALSVVVTGMVDMPQPQ